MADLGTDEQMVEALDRFGRGASTAAVNDTVTACLDVGFDGEPSAPAVRSGDRVISYGELDAMSSRIAHALIDAGVGAGDRVGICMERSVELIASLVGVLRSGAAYVPLDPGYPQERLRVMRADADLRILLAHERALGWDDASDPTTRTWESLQSTLDRFPADRPGQTSGPEDSAYVIFTSGSTGRPKGIDMPHRALANLVEWQLRRPSFAPGARVVQYSSISFDVSFQEIATTLASGGELHLIDDDERRDARVLHERLAEWRIQRLFVPYVAFRSLIEVAVRSDLPLHLTEVITAGEQLRVDDEVRRFFARHPATTLDNQYGPSETHVITAHLLTGDPDTWPDLPPIGQPIDNCGAYVLDDDLQPVPTGVSGHIHLGGRNLAHGYFGQDEMTQRAFIENPHVLSDHRTLYRSGDLGHHDEAGELHYEGRVDHQVKIRGHRVELGEVNAVCARFDGVAQCLTRVLERSSGARYLVSYFTTEPDASVNVEQLRAHLVANVPDYMVPAFLVPVADIAYGPSGKADLSALPDPRDVAAGESDTYRSETETRLASIWSEILEFPNVPRDVGFLALGGDSLSAVTLFLRVTETFGVDLPLASLAQAPTIEAMARVVDDAVSGPEQDQGCLQILAAGSAGVPPLVLVHGGGGNVLLFGPLAEHLGPEQPVYAFQWSGWSGERGDRTIPEMARTYCRELRAVRPHGPYRLGGHCIGALIAIEMARLLEADGETVEGPLIVSDAPNLAASSYDRHDPRHSEESFERFKLLQATLLDRVPAELQTGKWRGDIPSDPMATTLAAAQGTRGGLAGAIARIPGARAASKYLPQLPTDLRIRALRAAGKRIPVDLRLRHCQLTLRPAARRHHPTPYGGDMLYFRTGTAEGRGMALSGWWDDVYMGFEELCRGRFEGHVVGGGHNDALKLPFAADLIRDAFAAADTTSAGPASLTS